LNISPANRVTTSQPDEPAVTRSSDAQAQHCLRCCTGVVLWQHRSTTAELPFT